jgi:lauroyl/myristoyl acyltransferase
MITLDDLRLWKYYFFDLPLLSAGIKTPDLQTLRQNILSEELARTREGYIILCRRLNRPVSEAEAEDCVKKSLWVKLIRESDAFSSLKMGPRTIKRYFRINGIENLRSVTATGKPVILLTGHIGSFFIPAIAFSSEGYIVYPVARSVDRSNATPLATQLYLTLNYRLSGTRFPGKYLFTDFSGRIDRDIITVLRNSGILWTAIDMPRRLYAHKRLPVILFGKPSSLPSGIIQWGLKKNAVFLTSWNTVEISDNGNYCRHLTVDPPISAEPTVESILQVYADRLTKQIGEKPWQWMGLQIIKQYDESEGLQNE